MDISKLPFVVQPRRQPITERIGSEEAGFIAIERRGYLTSGEKAFVQQALTSDDSTIKIIDLARKISNSEGITLEEGYQRTVQVLNGSRKDDEDLRRIEAEHFSDFTDVINTLSIIQSREQLLAAVCLLRYRVSSEFGVDEVLQLHPDIITGLAELYRDEDQRSIERFKEQEQEQATDDDSEELDVLAMEKKPSRRSTKSS